jgi:hypothetical protein
MKSLLKFLKGTKNPREDLLFKENDHTFVAVEIETLYRWACRSGYMTVFPPK